jgi:hypothetical protein
MPAFSIKNLKNAKMSSLKRSTQTGLASTRSRSISLFLLPGFRLLLQQLQQDVFELLEVVEAKEKEDQETRSIVGRLNEDNTLLQKENEKLKDLIARLRDHLDEQESTELVTQEMVLQIATRGGVVQQLRIVPQTTVVDIEESAETTFQGLNARRNLEREKQALLKRLLDAEESKAQIARDLASKHEEAQGLSTRLQNLLAQFKDNLHNQAEVQASLERARDTAKAEAEALRKQLDETTKATQKIIEATQGPKLAQVTRVIPQEDAAKKAQDEATKKVSMQKMETQRLLTHLNTTEKMLGMTGAPKLPGVMGVAKATA